MFEGTIEEKFIHGITPIRWIYQIKTITNYTLKDAIWSVENHERRKLDCCQRQLKKGHQTSVFGRWN